MCVCRLELGVLWGCVENLQDGKEGVTLSVVVQIGFWDRIAMCSCAKI